ncbi:hypothetical protein AAFM79_01735 [Trichormus azollae HNT15244]
MRSYLAKGISKNSIAKLVDCSPSTLYDCLERKHLYKSHDKLCLNQPPSIVISTNGVRTAILSCDNHLLFASRENIAINVGILTSVHQTSSTLKHQPG